ncbi:MAG: hypothetical protein IT581_06065 [Verrucomicrobiales bacterium]|nr:hypothetical protein [Verrucomicrobiales bacterium]
MSMGKKASNQSQVREVVARWLRTAPLVIVSIGCLFVVWISLQSASFTSELKERVHQETVLCAKNLLTRVDSYFDAVYDALLFISLDTEITSGRTNSAPLIQRLYEHQWENHRLHEIYVIDKGFRGQSKPLMTFERGSEGIRAEMIHSFSREEDEYRVQTNHLEIFRTHLQSSAAFSEEVPICAPGPHFGRSIGYVYSVPIRSGTAAGGLIAGMIKKSTVLDLLRPEHVEDAALLVSSTGRLLGDPAVIRDIGERVREGLRNQRSATFVQQQSLDLQLQPWSSVSMRTGIYDGEEWWLVYLYDVQAHFRRTLLTSLLGRILLGVAVLGTAILVAWLFRTLNRRLSDQSKKHSERVQLEQEAEAVTDTRQRQVGVSLHEDLCQRLTGLEALARGLEKKLNTRHAQESEVAGEIAAELRESLHFARQLADELQPVSLLQEGFVAALEELVLRTDQPSGPRCRIEISGPPFEIDVATATQAYRIIETAVASAVQHAGARELVLAVAATFDDVVVSLRHDRTLHTPEAHQAAATAMRLIRYRADLIGAQCDWAPQGEEGISLTCRWNKSVGSSDFGEPVQI